MLRVAEICKEKGITQQNLARKLGIQYQSLYAALNGNPKLETLQGIAAALEVEVWELFTSSTSKEELTALISHKGDFYKATTIEELERIVEKIKQNL